MSCVLFCRRSRNVRLLSTIFEAVRAALKLELRCTMVPSESATIIGSPSSSTLMS